MPYVVERNHAVVVKLSAEDLKELVQFLKQAPSTGPLRIWWIKEIESWMKKS